MLIHNPKKWKGIIDYQFLFLCILYVFILYTILNLFRVPILQLVYIILISTIPLIGVYILISKEENVMLVIKDIINYMILPKLYTCELYGNSDVQIIRNIKRNRLKKQISSKFYHIVKLTKKWYNKNNLK